VTVLCQIWTDFRLISELAESQRNRPVGKTCSVSGTARYEYYSRSDNDLKMPVQGLIKQNLLSKTDVSNDLQYSGLD
jgi:hypothetical protein